MQTVIYSVLLGLSAFMMHVSTTKDENCFPGIEKSINFIIALEI